MKNKTLLAVFIALGLGQTAVAQSSGGISPKLSTLGVGLEYQHNISNNWGVSAGFYGYNYGRNEVRNNIRYDAKLKLRHFAVLGHYYPWENGFRFSGGAVLNNSKITGDAINSGTIDLDGVDYTVADVGSVHAKADFRKVAPYLGVGWDSGDRSNVGLSFSADLGVMFTGKPDVSLTAQCAGGCPQFIIDAAARERNNLQDDLDSFKFYPVLSIGATYRF